MAIEFYFEEIKSFEINDAILIKWFNTVVRSENKSIGDIVFIFCSDSYLLEMNNNFLNHDYYTDVITFDYVERDIISGDIFLSYERVMENSVVYGVSFDDELHRVMVHGILHLIGYNDKSEEEQLIMKEKEDFYLGEFLKLM